MKIMKGTMFILLIQLISADVLLVDDLNLGRTPGGSRSLANLTGNLQNQYGEKVNIVSPMRSQNTMPINASYYNNQPRANPIVRIHNIGTTTTLTPVPPRNTVRAIRKFSNMTPNSLSLTNNFRSNPSQQLVLKPIMPMQRQSPNILNDNNQPTSNRNPLVYSPIYYPNGNTSDSTLSDPSNDLKTELPRKPSVSMLNRPRPGLNPANSTSPIKKQPKTVSGLPNSTKDDLSSPEIDKDIDESIFDNDPISPSNKSEEPKKETTTMHSTKTVTKTVKEPVKIVEPVSITISEKKDDSDNHNIPYEIEQAAKEVSKIVVPHVKGVGYLKKHNSDILSADKNRRTYIDYKLLESKSKQAEIEKKLKALQELQEKIMDKLANIKGERDEIKSKIESTQISAENSEGAVKTLQSEMNKNSGDIKLEEIEIMRLEKALSEEKNRYLLLTDQQKVYKSRFDRYVKNGDLKQGNVKINKKKLIEYEKLVKQIEFEFSNLKERIEEVERKRNSEIEEQNKLEIEKKEIEDVNHLPLFALYD